MAWQCPWQRTPLELVVYESSMSVPHIFSSAGMWLKDVLEFLLKLKYKFLIVHSHLLKVRWKNIN